MTSSLIASIIIVLAIVMLLNRQPFGGSLWPWMVAAVFGATVLNWYAFGQRSLGPFIILALVLVALMNGHAFGF